MSEYFISNLIRIHARLSNSNRIVGFLAKPPFIPNFP